MVRQLPHCNERKTSDSFVLGLPGESHGSET